MMTAPTPYPTLLAGSALVSCGDPATTDPAGAAVAAMYLDTYTQAIRTLSSEVFEGRAPSTPRAIVRGLGPVGFGIVA